jgi:hypothetical protein
MPLDDNGEGARHRRRVRIERPRTLFERIGALFAMPHLTRQKRNERIAIIVMIVAAVVYFVFQPLVASFFDAAPSRSSSPSPSPSRNTDKEVRPDKRAPFKPR